MKFTQDSRLVEKGDCFIALPGDTTDGHTFIEDALRKGAHQIVYHDETYTKLIPPAKRLHVLDTESWLQTQAVSKLKTDHIIAITGSVGKTLTTQLLFHIMTHTDNPYSKSVFCPHIGINTLRGICLEIVNEYKGQKLIILETAMDYYLELDSLAQVLKPDIAAIVNIDISHFVKLGSMDRILRTKFGVCTTPLQHLILNGENKYIEDFMKNKFREFSKEHIFIKPRTIWFIDSNSNDAKMNPSHLQINLNIALQILALLSPKVRQKNLQSVVESFACDNLRFQIQKWNKVTILNDTYNAAPLSFKAFFTYCAKQPGTKLGIIGQINEIGVLSESVHRKIAVEALEIFETVLFVGKEFEHTIPSTKHSHWFESQEKATEFIKSNKLESSFMFVGLKGSRGIGLDQIVTSVWTD